jgi:hypothetical protein
MPGNSDKSSEKPKLAQTVQTLLAAKNDLTQFFSLSSYLFSQPLILLS